MKKVYQIKMTENQNSADNTNNAGQSSVGITPAYMHLYDSSQNAINLANENPSMDLNTISIEEEKREILAEKRYYDAISDLIDVATPVTEPTNTQKKVRSNVPLF